MSITDDRPAAADAGEPPAPAAEEYRLSKDSWTLVIFGLAALAILVAVFAAAVAFTRDGDGGGGESAESAAGAGAALTAELSEFAINLSATQVDAAGVVTVTNAGTIAHNLAVVGTDLTTPDLAAGESAELDLSGLAPGTYTLICTIAGHEASGMTTTLAIGAGDDALAPAGDDHVGMTEEEAAAMDEAMLASAKAFPAETEGRGNQPLEPEILPNGVKRFELEASIVDWEVEPGKIVQAWAYNGTVPGPRIDVEVGDTVEVEIVNNLPVGTDIHWHGIDVPNDQDGVAGITQDMIMPGETYTYSYTVSETAVGMYHAHAHGEIAVPNGLFGAMYVGDMELPRGQTISGYEIPDDLELAQDFPMVLNDAGEIGLSLDGKSYPATQPVTAKVGDWIQVTYFNEGLQVHPMHLHGFEQFVIAKDGEELDQPYAADTILVGPGERYTVIFSPDLPGVWVWHCHILNHAESSDGLFGMVTAIIVE